MLEGFTPPYTLSGQSSLVAPPPWRYAGQVLSIGFAIDRAVAQTLLPEGLEATGQAAARFCEWQATTDGSELVDPAYAQYKEFFALIEVVRDGARLFYCPFIYVDQDISMARGWLQGWPKKLGSIWMTRSYGLDCPAAAPIREGTRFGASLAVKDRRLAEATLTLTGAPGEPIGFLAAPVLGLLGSPSIFGTPSAGERRLVRALIADRIAGPVHGARATLEFLDSPRDELSLMQPRAVRKASLSTLAMAIAGALAL